MWPDESRIVVNPCHTLRLQTRERRRLTLIVRYTTVFCAVFFAYLLSGKPTILRAATLEIVVPAYFYPSAGSDWNELTAAADDVPVTAIMNPFNGPGNLRDNNYVSAVNSLRSAGGRVIGYVYSSYSERPLQ